MQALSLRPQYCEAEQTPLLYKIIKLLVGHYSNVKTDQYSLAVEVQCPGKKHGFRQSPQQCLLACVLLRARLLPLVV